MIPGKLFRYAALGALGVVPGTAALYALLLLAFRLIAAWHVDFSRQLKAGKNSCPGV